MPNFTRIGQQAIEICFEFPNINPFNFDLVHYVLNCAKITAICIGKLSIQNTISVAFWQILVKLGVVACL